MKIEVTHAHMHGTMHVPTLNIQLKTTLDQKTYSGMKMFRLENGDLEVEYKEVYFIIPYVNFKVLTCRKPTPEAKKPTTETKKKDA